MVAIWGPRDDRGAAPARVAWVMRKSMVSWSTCAGMFLHIGMRVRTARVGQVSIIVRANIVR